jgi:dTDP-4-dehydrorhamnose reductase
MNASAGLVEIWGGMECTVNRVGDEYFDQLARTGHDRADDDLDRFAALGLRTLRYPLLWERVAPDTATTDWTWCDRRMSRLSACGIRPVVGLLHHGSGPRYTSLVDPAFATRFTSYAAAVAERYPWVPLWILVNEPLTTARFSCLYGHWYPHARDDRLFAQAIVGQCTAIARATAAIRAINPDARFVQSEDLGFTASTPPLSYQALMENERRWLTFDLLCGRVRPGHVMWEWLRRAGADIGALAWLADHPSPPDILGINHYLTSERFLDHRPDRYPPRWRGGNGRDRYADVESVRVCAEGPVGLEALLRDAWDRYAIPIAITEAHLDCTRDEQVRWLVEERAICERLAHESVPVVALTVWSLLGSFGWNELMTSASDYYESGVFDIRGPARRETRLADVVRCWTAGRRFDHPVLDGEGWWQRPVRLLYPPVSGGHSTRPRTTPGAGRRRSITVTDASPFVRREFERACHLRDLAVRFTSADELTRARHMDRHADQIWAVVFAGLLREVHEPAAAPFDIGACSRLAVSLADAGCHVTLLSSQEVFGAPRDAPYVETDLPSPRTQAGRLAAAAEAALSARPASVLIARSALCFDGDDGSSACLERFEAWCGNALGPATECSLTYLPDLIRCVLDLIIDGEHGVWHLANRGARSVARIIGMLAPEAAAAVVEDRSGPGYCLESVRGARLPNLNDALLRAAYPAGVSSSTAPRSTSVSL